MMRLVFLFLSVLLAVTFYPDSACKAQRRDTGFATKGAISLEQFKTLFNRDIGTVRLVLLLSPT